MKAARSPRERPHRTPGPRGRVSQQRCRSPEPDCPHRSSPPGTRETASSARDRPPQRSASSDPSANRGGIIQPESNNSVRFHTTKTQTDPVAAGVVPSLNRPGGNVTGVTGLGGELGSKRLELLHEAIPKATKFAALVNPANPVTAQEAVQSAQMAARRLGLEFIVINASTENEIEKAFASAVQQGAGWLYAEDSYFENRRDQVAALGLRHALPTMTGSRESAGAGVLMFYGVNFADFYRQAGVYVGRILKGEKPGDLPVVQPTKFELVINLKTAKAIGIEVPRTLLDRGREVNE